MMKSRTFNCLYDPERKELTYGYKHGCIDGYAQITVREVNPKLDRAIEKMAEALACISDLDDDGVGGYITDTANEALETYRKAIDNGR